MKYPFAEKTDVLEDHTALINKWNRHQVEGINLNHGFDYVIKDIAIIDGPNVDRAVNSVKALNGNYKVFSSFNILDTLKSDVIDYYTVAIENINIPKEYERHSWLQHIRAMAHGMVYSEITRVLNHMAVWDYIITQKRPMIVLEHDAVLLTPITRHLPRNSIINLIGKFPLMKHNTNWLCMNNVSAYSVDPFVSKKLFNEVMTYGIRNPLELMIRADKYLILQQEGATRIIDQGVSI